MKEMNMGQMKMFFEACKSNNKKFIEDLRIEFDINDNDIDIIFKKVTDNIKSSIYEEEITKNEKENLKDEDEKIIINGVTYNANNIDDARILANLHASNFIDLDFSINDYLNCTNRIIVLSVVKEIKKIFGITEGALIGFENIVKSERFGHKYLNETTPLQKMTDPLGLILLCISNIKNYLIMAYSEDTATYEMTEEEADNFFNISMKKAIEIQKEILDLAEKEIKFDEKDISELSLEENFDEIIDKAVNEFIEYVFKE